ncbi:MAG: hypothetical protein AB1349_05510 [Elusimicrobiota bacterium]
MDLGYPFKYFLSQNIKEKGLPLWCSNAMCGFPIHANGEGGFFYPINLLFFILLSTLSAFNWNIIISFLIASIFTYLYARNLGLTEKCKSLLKYRRQNSIIGH